MNWEQILMTIVANYLNIIVVVVFVLFLIVLWKRGKKKEMIQIIRYLVAKAETELGSKTGQIKKGKVIAELYERLPFVITILYSEKDISELIEKAVIELDEFLERHENYLTKIEGGIQ